VQVDVGQAAGVRAKLDHLEQRGHLGVGSACVLSVW
jgi:hypothetical protein